MTYDQMINISKATIKDVGLETAIKFIRNGINRFPDQFDETMQTLSIPSKYISWIKTGEKPEEEVEEEVEEDTGTPQLVGSEEIIYKRTFGTVEELQTFISKVNG